MSYLQTNVFRITNIEHLKSRYKLYRIEGLSSESDNYYRNAQIINRKMSYKLRNPALVILVDGQPHLVLRDDASEPESPFQLIGTTAYFQNTGHTLDLDYGHPTETTAPICQRFLQFALTGALRSAPSLWQPSAGESFYGRQPVLSQDGVDVFRGFSVRTVLLHGNAVGLCVDVSHKYMGHHPLSSRLTKADFRKLKGTRCVYRYGSQWYDIKLHEHSGLSISQYLIPDGKGGNISLCDYVLRNSQKPLPPELLKLDADGSALLYMTGRDDTMAAVAQLCYPVFETEHPKVQRLHRTTILPPDKRRILLLEFARKHLAGLAFCGFQLQVDGEPIRIPKQCFMPPDLLFGHNTVYSARGTEKAVHIGLDELGRTRLTALFDKAVGTFATRPLDRQYIIWPQSVADTYGQAFLNELKATVDDLYPSEFSYDPTTITYDDLRHRTLHGQGRAILEAVDAASPLPGYGIVMLNDIRGRDHGEDQLAAMVMRKMRERDIYVSVIHGSVPRTSYQLPANAAAGVEYTRIRDNRQQSRLKGYLRNIALTKVLLTNGRWPFVLATPLHADMTIGIDVKQHTACFVFVDKNGAQIRTECRESNQKEMLGRQQVRTVLLDVLRQELGQGLIFNRVKSVVVHRDGRYCGQEVKGIQDALATLQKESSLPSDYTVTFIEIHKRSAISVRLFDVGNRSSENPQVGSWWRPFTEDAYLCSTGRAFPRPGSVLPLHVKLVRGVSPFEKVLEDVYALTCLTWTRPEDCTRYPITLKLADIRLREQAGDYDSDALEYGEDTEQEVEDE